MNAQEYELNPKLCKTCTKVIPWSKKKNYFCNQSCAATTRNMGMRRHGNPRNKCCMCATWVKPGVVACIKHSTEHKILTGAGITSKPVRDFLSRTRGWACEMCELTEWLDHPIPLELDHIDGNHMNNLVDNIRLLCHNCHALTPTFRAKNKGNGREYRRKAYAG